MTREQIVRELQAVEQTLNDRVRITTSIIDKDGNVLARIQDGWFQAPQEEK